MYIITEIQQPVCSYRDIVFIKDLTGCFSMRPADEITKKVKQIFGLVLPSNG